MSRHIVCAGLDWIQRQVRVYVTCPRYKYSLFKGCLKTKLKLNSVAQVPGRTIPTERPQLVGEVSAKLCV
jgi:hypothetical protein